MLSTIGVGHLANACRGRAGLHNLMVTEPREERMVLGRGLGW